MTQLKVENYPNLVRDGNSKAIIMNSIDSFKTYQVEKTFRESISKARTTSQEDINNIKEDINEIKTLLVSLFQKIEQNKA